MIRRLLALLLDWVTRPMYDTDDPLDEYWARKDYGNGYRGD